MKRTGIYGGSFNPIHNGHIELARCFLRQAQLDEVWFMVSPQNPFKQQSDLLDEQLRLQLVRLALAGEPRMRASDFEFSLPRPSYTWHTLQRLSRRYPKRAFTLLVGGDNWEHFPQWFHAQDILDNYAIAVYPRGEEAGNKKQEEGDERKKERGERREENEKRGLENTHVTLIDAPLIAISSTQVRQLIGNRQPIDHLVPPRVAQAIAQNHYYEGTNG